MREGCDHKRGLPQAVVSPEIAETCIARKPKGAEAIPRERGLWFLNGRCSSGFNFQLQCPSQRGGCNANLEGGCRALQLLSLQQDVGNQKGQLEGEIEAVHCLYPKLDYELNFIERLWCATKRHAR